MNKLSVIEPSATIENEDIRKVMVQRARDMIPELVARQAETEKRGYYAADTHKAFEEAGFYGILMPKEFGGLDLDVKTYYQVVMAFAQGCPSTSWQFCLGSAHAMTICGMYDNLTQHKIFEIDEPFICAMTAAQPQGELRRQPNGDWQLNGVFRYASGIPYSSHFSGHTSAFEIDGSEVGVSTFVAPRSEWTMLDDWGGSFGMKGSGSNSVRFDNATIPADYVLENTLIMTHRSAPRGVGHLDSDNPLYYGGTLSLWLLEPTAMTLGMVKGALAECATLMKTKTTPVPPIMPRLDNPDFQRWFGAAAAKIATAEAAFYDACDKWTEDARLNMLGLRDPSDPREMLSNVICAEVMEICWEAMQLLFRVAGTSPMFDGQRMQRIYRDISTARSHGFNTRFDGMHRDLSQHLLAQS